MSWDWSCGGELILLIVSERRSDDRFLRNVPRGTSVESGNLPEIFALGVLIPERRRTQSARFADRLGSGPETMGPRCAQDDYDFAGPSLSPQGMARIIGSRRPPPRMASSRVFCVRALCLGRESVRKDGLRDIDSFE
mgnify:CR=1 FL=1